MKSISDIKNFLSKKLLYPETSFYKCSDNLEAFRFNHFVTIMANIEDHMTGERSKWRIAIVIMVKICMFITALRFGISATINKVTEISVVKHIIVCSNIHERGIAQIDPPPRILA